MMSPVPGPPNPRNNYVVPACECRHGSSVFKLKY